MVLQRLGGDRDLLSPRLKILESVFCSRRRLWGDLILSEPRVDGEARPKSSLHLDLGRGEDTKLLKKCRTGFTSPRRRLEECIGLWGEDDR